MHIKKIERFSCAKQNGFLLTEMCVDAMVNNYNKNINKNSLKWPANLMKQKQPIS